ncbi:MAG: ATP-binding protein [Geobacteraceae bacterium]|nr:ATP-binding protein [Geobacteraceae bacterium]
MRNRDIELDIKVPNQTRYLSLIGRIGEDIAREIDRFSGDRETLAYQINLVLTEAMTNAIKYGNSDCSDNCVHILINIAENELLIRIFDFGQGFDINEVQSPDFNQLEDRGRGIFLIREIMDSVTYIRNGDNGNVLEMIKQLD